MQFYILVLIACFFIFLFYIHYSAKEDFVFIRKNVSLEQLFNVAFLTGFVALFFARLFFVLFHPSIRFINPLVFFGIPYFPGLSLSGGILGAFLFLLLYGKQRKAPTTRMGDIFSVGFLLVVPLGFLLTAILSNSGLLLYSVGAGISLVLFFFYLRFLIPRMLGGQFKDGTIMYLFLMNFPLVFLLSHIISRAALNQFYFLPEDVVYIGLFVIGLIMYLRQENTGRKRIPKSF